MNHYHIRWAGSKIDWQAFQTKDEAVAEAEHLKRPDENYNIEERNGICEESLCRMRNTRSRDADRNTQKVFGNITHPST